MDGSKRIDGDDISDKHLLCELIASGLLRLGGSSSIISFKRFGDNGPLLWVNLGVIMDVWLFIQVFITVLWSILED